jgi:H+-transporting ATPase
VAKAVKLDGAIYPPGPIQAHVDPMQFVVFADVLPEDKYQLVKAFQNSGHTVGMCGDGANDAPALRQAQMGIAVSSATDVAKAAAGMVLTKPGLAGIVAAVKEGRITFQRILTYTMNSVIKKIVSVLFLIFGLVVTGQAILTPLLMVIIMITGDFLAMSLTTDNVRASPAPNRWQIGHLTGAGIALGSALLIFDASMIAIGKYALHMGIDELRSLCFIVLVFGGQGTLYAIRDRRRLWGSRPSNWLIASSLADLLIAGTLAARGLAMTRLPIVVVLGTLIASLAFSILLGLLKLPIFRRFDII